MNEERPTQLTKWYVPLAFAAGSVLTVIVTAFDRGRSLLMDGLNPSVGLTLIGWTVFGAVTGAWMLLAQSWRNYPREPRLRLAAAYLVVGWGGLFGMSLYTPALSAVLVAALIAAAIVFLAHELEGRQRKQDEGDIFP